MEYQKKIKRRLIMNIVFFIVGICALVIGIHLKVNTEDPTFSQGYLTGTGGALAVIGLVMTVKKYKLLNNKDKLKLQKIEEEDERNLHLAYKASHYSLMITALCLYIISFVFAFSNETVLITLNSILGALLFGRFVFYYILRRSI